MALEFEWDARKAARNQGKHGVSFEEAATLLGDPPGGIIEDPRQSADEVRYVLAGLSRRGRFLVVMFTERGSGVRIISARLGTRRERSGYEERTQ